MKRLNSFFVLLFAVAAIFLTMSSAFATAPERLNYQGTLTDNNGNPITGTVSMVFNIYDQLTGGNLIWGPETIGSAQVRNGLFSVVLGEIVPVSASMFSSGSRYISVMVNGEPMSPRQLINSVPYALNGIPSGVIAMWSGAVNNIPTGWALCDGTNGTPDLRDRFVVGAGSGYGVGVTGGVSSINLSHAHTLNATDTNHSHWVNGHILTVNEMPTHDHGGATGSTTIHTANGSKSAGQGSTYYERAQTSHSHTIPPQGGGAAHDHAWTGTVNQNASHSHSENSQLSGAQDIRPPYYALAFIMKL